MFALLSFIFKKPNWVLEKSINSAVIIFIFIFIFFYQKQKIILIKDENTRERCEILP